MQVLLSLETSTDVCSVAVHKGDRLLAVGEVHMGQAHASKLPRLVKEVLAMANVTMKDLGGVAVSAGPGSYTGLRIGTSTAKGLCYALDIPLLSVGTLDIMAAHMSSVMLDYTTLCPMIDARRMEVYCALYNRHGIRLTDVEARIIEVNSFGDELSTGPIVFGGNGSDKCRSVLTHFNVSFMPGVFPSARHLGALAAQKLMQGAVEDLMHFEPFYLKDFKAKMPTNIIASGVNKPA